MNPDEITKKVIEDITNQKFENEQSFTKKQVGDIISVVSIMVADPEPATSEDMYRALIEYLNLPPDLENHMLKEIVNARRALKMALALQSGNVKELLGCLSSILGKN